MQMIEGKNLGDLEILEDRGDKVYCRCMVCNSTGLYDKEYLLKHGQECRVCKKAKTASEDESINETTKINILLAEEKLRNEGKVTGIKAGKKFVITDQKYKAEYPNIGKTLEVIGVYGEWDKLGNKQITHIVTYCTKCKALKLREINTIKGLKVSYGCKTCDVIEKYKKEQEESYNKYIKAEELKKQQKELNKADATKVAQENAEKHKKELEERADKRKELHEEKELNEYAEMCRKNNPDSYVRVEVIDGKKVVTFACKRCGYMITKVRPNKNFKITECVGCRKKLRNRDYRGVCQLNMIGRVYNGMEITKQYTDPEKGYLCDIKCTECGSPDSIHEGVYLMDVMNRKYYHDCEKSLVNVKCSNCGMHVDIKISDISTNEIVLCPLCHKPIDRTSVDFEVNENDARVNFTKARVLADGSTKISSWKPSANGKLFYDPIPIYRSNDEDYYRCICKEHGARLTLSETEINNYACERCNDVYEDAFKVLNPTKIRIKGNMKIKNETDK